MKKIVLLMIIFLCLFSCISASAEDIEIYMFGKKNEKLCTVIYTIIALVFIFLGTLASNDLVWELTDAFNYLMVLPNAIALFALTGIVKSSVKEIDKK